MSGCMGHHNQYPGYCMMQQTIVEYSNKSSLAVVAEISLQHTHCIVVATIEK